MKKAMILTVLLLALAIGFAIAEKEESPAKSADIKALVKGNTEFALNLYGKLRDEKKGNIFFSPYSISTALAMTYAGARNKTEEEMQSTLCFPNPKESKAVWAQDKLHTAFSELLNQTKPGKDSGYQLSVANALWGQKGFPWLKEFLADSQKYYGAGLLEVDYINDTEKARQTINAWVEKQTNDKIKELIKKDILNELTRLVLTNAIYFKGSWAEEFDKKLTKEGEFFISEKEKAKAQMMNKKTKFNYMQDGDFPEVGNFQCLEMPYKGNELSMVILLPKKDMKFSDFEGMLTNDNIATWLKKLNQAEVIVSLPKFKTTCEFELSDVLKNMGMPDAFSMSADFSGLNGKKDLYITNVIHKAFVDVNEEGTEAAAATAVIIGTKSMPERPTVFCADHPFIFFIRDLRTDSILFMGRIIDPTK